MAPSSSNNFPKLSRTAFILVAILHPFLTTTAHSCYYTHRTVTNVPYHKFWLQAGRTCWEYCRNLRNCTAVSFLLDTSGECCLYNNDHLNYEVGPSNDHHGHFKETMVVGKKSCLLMKDIERIFVPEVPSTSSGVYIQQRETGGCLGVSLTPWITGESWQLDWVNCSDNTLWIVQSAQPGSTDIGNFVRIRDKQTGCCMTTVEAKCGGLLQCPLAVVKNCTYQDQCQKLFHMYELYNDVR